MMKKCGCGVLLVLGLALVSGMVLFVGTDDDDKEFNVEVMLTEEARPKMNCIVGPSAL